MSIPSNAFVMTSCAIDSACASREAGVASMAAAALPSNVLLITFWIVGTRRVPVIAARHAAFSAFQFLAIVASAFQLYQTGFDSLTALAFSWIDVSAFASHGGIQAAMRAADDCAAINSPAIVNSRPRMIWTTH